MCNSVLVVRKSLRNLGILFFFCVVIQCRLCTPCWKSLDVHFRPKGLWDRKESWMSALEEKRVGVNVHKLVMVDSIRPTWIRFTFSTIDANG